MAEYMNWQAIEIGALVPGFVSVNGAIATNVVDDSMRSELIPVVAGESLLVEVFCPANKRLWEGHEWFDSNGSYISDAYYSGSSGSTTSSDRTLQHELTAPGTAAFIMLSATQLSANGTITLYRSGGGWCFNE